MAISNKFPSVICFVISGVLALDMLQERLPADENEARRRLADGTLDSATWELVRGYYDDPVSVPLGELRYLADLFPWIAAKSCIQEENLKEYEPWNEECIRRFFSDHPRCEDLRPILSFDVRRIPAFGTLRFNSRTRSSLSVPRQSVWFSLSPVGRAGIDGAGYFENEYARWQRRRMWAKISSHTLLQAGNFSLNPGQGLVFGYFPDHEKISTGDNWMYGSARTWNGMAAGFSVPKHAGIDVFAHRRPTETAAGCEAALFARPNIQVLCGLAGLEARLDGGGRDTTVTVTAGATARFGPVDVGVHAAIADGEMREMPFVMTGQASFRGGKFRARFMSIPAGYDAVRSRLVHDAVQVLELEQEEREDMLGIDMNYSEDFDSLFRYSFSMLYRAAATVSALRARWEIAGCRPLDYTLSYTFKPAIRGGNAGHAARLSGQRRLSGKVELQADLCYFETETRYRRVTVSCGPAFDAVPSVTVQPEIRYSVNNRAEHEVLLELAQRLSLFEKTYGEFRCILPLTPPFGEGISLYAGNSFAF